MGLLNTLWSSKPKTLLAGLILYAVAELAINYMIRHIESLHWAKDGGIVSAAFLHCALSYLFFIFLRRSAPGFLGLGMAAGVFSCIVAIGLASHLPLPDTNFFSYILVLQLLASFIVAMLGILYLYAKFWV